MKIAFLNLYSGINSRGAESFTHDLANRLSRDFSVTFFQGGEKTPEQKIKVITLPTRAVQPRAQFTAGFFRSLLKRLFLDPANLSVLRFSLKLLPQLLFGHYDLVFPLNGFWQLLLIKLIRPVTKFKIIVIGHSGPGWDERLNLYLRPDLFIALTPSARAWARKTCSGTKTLLIPLAIDPLPYRKAEPAIPPLPSPVILCPAALVDYKQVDLAIRAVAKFGQASLFLLGRGDREAELVELGKALLGKRFFQDSLPHQRMPSAYRAADLVTYPSSAQENSPIAFLEAMAAGKPVVARDSERNRWLLGQAGVYCHPEDLDAYAAALGQALIRSKAAGFSRIVDQQLAKFSWFAVLNKYKSAINQLCKLNNH